VIPHRVTLEATDLDRIVANNLGQGVSGVWFLNAARIVYVIDEPRRFSFAYGTLPGHAERGG